MKDFSVFETALASRIGRPTTLRPFVCDGSPLECDVFIVGFNPATQMSADFWQYWQPGVGFDKCQWLTAYKEERRKRRRRELSNTRLVLRWIGEELGPVRILETNLYWRPTRKARELKPKERDIEPFRWLLTTIQPRVIVAHGKKTQRIMQNCSTSACVIRVDHLSRGWSQAKARKLAKQIERKLDRP